MSYRPRAVVLAVIAGMVPQPGIEAQNEVLPWPTGSVKVLSGSLPCEGDGCELEVTCANVAVPARAIVKASRARAEPARGTVLLMTGGPGTELYETQSRRVPEELQAAGFSTVQLQWVDSWLYASAGEAAGHARLGCRPATVARWVHNNLHAGLPESGYCAAGNSGGAMQIGYMLTYYGLEELLDTAVPSGGPPTGRLDLSCIPQGPELEIMRLSVENDGFPSDRLIDAGFGYPFDGSGPCSMGDESHREQFRQASVASGSGDYVYPETLIWFLFGENDLPNIQRGMTYHDLLIDRGSPLVRLDVLPDVGHGVHRAAQGADKILEILINECHPRH